MSPIQQMLLGVGAVATKTYIDDVFSTYVYEGDGTTNHQIVNGIDLATHGGLIWGKERGNSGSHYQFDTVRGLNKRLKSNSDSAEETDTFYSSVNSNGYTINKTTSVNVDGNDYASWTFRKAPGFFDVVTYTGNGVQGRNISHNLGSVPGAIWVKKLNSTGDWQCYHRSLGATKYLRLNSDLEATTSSSRWDNTTPTSTYFRVGDNGTVNNNDDTYVAYLFAHDEQSFGENENASVIKCGSYEGNNNDDGTEVSLGWEPSFLLIKSIDTSDNWCIFDNLRGMTADGINDEALFPNASDAEAAGNYLTPTSTGFKLTTQSDRVNNNSTYIYLAIRRSDGYVGKPPELGTGVFAMDTGNGSSTIPCFDSGFPVDFALMRQPATTESWITGARLTGPKFLQTNTNDAEGTQNDWVFDSNVGWIKGTDQDSDYQSWMWKRHAGFDVVTYTGSGNAGQTLAHSLGRTPEMMWVANMGAGGWFVYHKGLNGGTNPEDYYLTLNDTSAAYDNVTVWHDTAPTSTHFTAGTATVQQYYPHIAMLFASTDVSAVGSYTGNGTSNSSSQEIVTGFAPRFLIVKKTSGSAYWVVLDTLRGWGSGDDKWLQLNDNAAQGDFNWGYPGPTGFVVRTNDSAINANNEKYIYYCHA